MSLFASREAGKSLANNGLGLVDLTGIEPVTS